MGTVCDLRQAQTGATGTMRALQSCGVWESESVVQGWAWGVGVVLVAHAR